MNTLVKIALLIAVAGIYPLMVGLGIEAFYPEPDWYQESCYRISAAPLKGDDDPPTEAEIQAQIERERECQESVNQKKQPYLTTLFVITSVAGLAAIASGALFFTKATGPAGPGLVLGGLFTILYGSIRGFQGIDTKVMFGMALVTLALVVVVSWRWFKTEDGDLRKKK